MTDDAPPTSTRAAAAAHPGRSPPSPRTPPPRLTGAPPSTTRRACVNSLEADRDALRIVQDPDFPRWLQQITATGGCAHPVHLSGHTTALDNATGEILHHYDTRNEPGERLLVRCRNRRAAVCPACSRLHAGDTFHLVRAGLIGGKNVPATVRARPRLFVTLTAPSFGPVHRSGTTCRPRRNGGACEHGRPLGCGTAHAPDAPVVGQPLCQDCYDYTAHVLWHAHASKLWDRFVIDVRRRLASSAGIVQSRFAHHARLSFARIAEYQKRAAVHVHAVVRLDGPDGPTDEPPPWGTPDRLTRAVHASAQRVTVRTPYSPAVGELDLTWGTQTDVRALHADGDGPDDDAVAAYVAKYVTKGTDETGAGTDHKVTTRDDIDTAPVSRHVRTLMHTCWRLGGLPDAITDAHWRYVGSGHTPGAALIAAGVAEDLAESRRLSAEASQQMGWDR